jgi:peptide/nickel transport system substrate-binding protein
MDPWPDPGIIGQLKSLGAKARIITGYRYDYEHLDLNVKGAFADRTLREAFARCVPRQQLVDRLVKPVYPAAGILESRFVLPFQPAYPAFQAAGRGFDTVDVAGAQRLLAGRRPTVRVGWRKDPEQLNQGRLDTVALLKASCGRAGFTIVDAGTPTFLDRELRAGAFDVAMFSWTGSPTIIGDSDIYTTGGPGNFTGYSNRQVDRLFAKLSRELDPGRQAALLRQIDGQLWADLATIPLFAYPALTATSRDVSGIVPNPTLADLSWNTANWRRS